MIDKHLIIAVAFLIMAILFALVTILVIYRMKRGVTYNVVGFSKNGIHYQLSVKKK